jgi:uncharacterized protein YlxW (UPF0749 family)
MMKNKTLSVFLSVAAIALLGTGCRSSLSVPFVDLSLGTAGHKHHHSTENHDLENKVNELEKQNQELKERLEKVEQSKE